MVRQKSPKKKNLWSWMASLDNVTDIKGLECKSPSKEKQCHQFLPKGQRYSPHKERLQPQKTRKLQTHS